MKKLLTGNEAVALGAYEAGVHFAAAYPGTPSTEILENIAPYKEIIAEWSPNEKVAFEAAFGASIAGARSLAAMKHVGLNVAADPFFTAGYTGVNGGMVLVVADDPGLHSSQNEQDSRYYAKHAKVAMLEPSNSQEAKDMVKKALEISEKYDTLVMMRMTTRVCHSKSLVEVGERQEVELRPYVKNLQKYYVAPAVAKQLHVKLEERLKKLEEFSNETELNYIEWNDRKIGVISSGVAYEYARETIINEINGDVSKGILPKYDLSTQEGKEKLRDRIAAYYGILGAEGISRLFIDLGINPLDIASEEYWDNLSRKHSGNIAGGSTGGVRRYTSQ